MNLGGDRRAWFAWLSASVVGVIVLAAAAVLLWRRPDHLDPFGFAAEVIFVLLPGLAAVAAAEPDRKRSWWASVGLGFAIAATIAYVAWLTRYPSGGLHIEQFGGFGIVSSGILIVAIGLGARASASGRPSGVITAFVIGLGGAVLCVGVAIFAAFSTLGDCVRCY